MSIKIIIHDSQQIYQAGMSIIGKVVCNLEGPDWIDVKIKFVGGEYTFVNSNDPILIIGHKRKFLETSDTVLKSGRFDPNDNEFYFNIILPRNIPSTYEGKHGHVKFFLMARMDVRWQQVYEDDVELRVFSPITMNIQMTAPSEWPMVHSDEFTESEGLWCYPEVAKLEVTMFKKVFTLNEEIPVEVMVESGSRTITTLKIEIFVAVQAKLSGTGNQDLVTTTKLVALKRVDFHHPEKEMTLNYRLRIMPTAKLPNFEKCVLFKHREFMKVTAFIQHSEMPQLTVEFGLVLGHLNVNNDRGGNQIARQRVEDGAIIRKISPESVPNHPISRPMPRVSLPSLGATNPHQFPFLQRFPGEASSRSNPGIASASPPPSYASIIPEYIGFRVPGSHLRRGLLGPMISSSEPNIIPSAPPEDDVFDNPHSVRTSRLSLENPSEDASGYHVPKLPTPPDDEVDLPPSYEETLLMNKRGSTCEERRRAFAS